MRSYLENSKIILFFSAMRDRLVFLKAYIKNLYKYSYIGNSIKGIKTYFKHSALLRMTDRMYYHEMSELFYGSELAKSSLRVYNLIEHSVASYSNRSIVAKALRGFREAFYSSPLIASGIILSCAVSTKLILGVILNKEITRLNLLSSIFFMLLGFIFLTSGVNWENLKKTSYILKFKK